MNLTQANVLELAGNAVRTSTLTGTGVDVSELAGVVQVVLQSSAATSGTTPTLDVKLQESSTLGGSYTDIVGATFAQVTDAADSTEMIAVKIDAVKSFVRVVGTIDGTATPTFGFGVALVGVNQAGRNSSQAV
jgi:hypothetical protein